MSKEEKTFALLSEIGEIDDIFLKEATSYRRKPKRNLWVPIVAACLALCIMTTALLSLSVMIPLGIVMLGNRFDVFDGILQNQSPELEDTQNGADETLGKVEGDGNDFETAPNGKIAALDLLLGDKSGEGVFSVESTDQISYDDASIIWQDSESGELFVKTLTSSEVESVKRNMGKGAQVGESSPKLTYRVWIVDENRVVSSPYLEDGVGNQSFAIFDYEAEIVPSDELIECISDILE